MNTLRCTVYMNTCARMCICVRVPTVSTFAPELPGATEHLFIFRFKQPQKAVNGDKELLSASMPGISSRSPSGTLRRHPPPIMFLWHSKQDFCRKSCQAQLLTGWPLEVPAKKTCLTNWLQKSPQVNV